MSSTAAHLTRRFFGSLRPGGPRRAEDEWACSQLLPSEVALWRRMRGFDRRHALGGPPEAERPLGAEPTPPVLAGGVLHDVGQPESGRGRYRRRVATLVRMLPGRATADE